MGVDKGGRAEASTGRDAARKQPPSALGPRPINFGAPKPVAANDGPDPRTLTGAINLDGTPIPSDLGDPSVESFLPGSIIPGTRYRVIQWLGEGGMGVVYEAEHVDIERRVALKILHAGRRGESTTLQQFRDEARAASKMGSEHVLDVFDFQELDDGRLMFAMELLTGTILRDELRGGPMYVPRALGIFRQVCKGLAAAHDAKIIHRDVKPENIALVERKGRRDFVKLLDFGIAAMMARPTEDDGETVGTPLYMAPELLLEHASWDLRVDIYSVGCTAYEALTGRPPFEGKVSEIVQAHVKKAPPPFASVGCNNVHPAIEAVVMRCLSKDPARRYANARELEAAWCEAQVEAAVRTTWDDLPLPEVDAKRRARLLRAMPDPRGPDLALYESDNTEFDEEAVVRGRVRTGPIVAATAVSLTAVIAALWITNGSEAQKEDAVMQAEAAVVTPTQPEASADDEAEEPPTESKSVEAAVEADPAEGPEPGEAIEAESEPEPEPMTQAVAPAAATRRARPGKRRSKRNDDAGEADRPTPSATSQRDSASDLIAQAAQAKKSGDKAGAERLLKRALAMEPRNVTALSRLSDVAFDRGQFQEAADYANKAVRISPRNAGLRLKLGDAYFKLRNYSKARRHYEKALELGNAAAARRIERVDEKGG